ncbi:MAG: hypothetical protein KDD94_00765 [Calditrichaeota bacterium]|nr:hypothetical protein [Calditrichota bacterium]
MSYKEKQIWLSMLSMLIVFGWYFKSVWPELTQGANDIGFIAGFFVKAVLIVIVINIISHIVLYIINYNEGNREQDEREKLIELKAIRNAYYVLVCGIVWSGAIMLITQSVLMVANIVLFFFILSELTNYLSQLILLRSGY